jgi:hypothetical protein
VLLVLLACAAPRVQAQRVSVWLDAGASSTRPPAGIAGEDAAYGTLGARLEAQLTPGLQLNATGQAGAGARAEDGRWLYGEASALLRQSAGPVRLLLDATGFGVRYHEPFTYDAQALRVQPGVSIPLGPARLSARADVLRGAWSSTITSEPVLPLPGGPLDETHNEGDLRVDGAEVTVGFGRARVALELGAHVHDATNGVLDGRYRGVSAAAAVPLGQVDVFAGLTAQRAVDEDELGFHAGGVLSVNERVQLVGALAQPVTDRVFGTRTGLGISLGASLLIGRAAPPAPRRLVEIGAATGVRRSVHVRLERSDLTRVAIAGSFNAWVPVAMERSGDGWTIALSLEPGTYQFAFRLPDGTWFVPEDAQGIVDDGFGQQNATLVVPPV